MNSIEHRPVDDKDIILAVEGVSKKYCRGLRRSLSYGVSDITSDLFNRDKSKALRKGEFWALKEVSFKLYRGESIGLVGANGSGKTTLLRIISGLIKPTGGTVEVKGRVVPLLALGAGFNPILTGRENIYVNMAVLGISEVEVERCFDDIVRFAEIGSALDAPVQSYSSGMQARLGFACAVHTNPDLLLIDEVLAVGDVRFRAKSFRKLHELRESGTSFFLVSHSSNAILLNCDLAMYLENGAQKKFSNPRDVILRYEEDLLLKVEQDGRADEKAGKNQQGQSSELEITALDLSSANKPGQNDAISGEPATLHIDCFSQRVIRDACVHIVIRKAMCMDEVVLTFNNIIEGEHLEIPEGSSSINIDMQHCGLKPGSYSAQVIIREGPLYSLCEVPSFAFTVAGEFINSMVNAYVQPHAWQVTSRHPSCSEKTA